MKIPSTYSALLPLSLALAASMFIGSCSNKHVVSISLTPAEPSVSQLGQTVQFRAMGATNHPNAAEEDVTSTATWTSSVGSVAKVDSNGLATATACGETVIMAQDGNVMGQTTLTVACSTPGGDSALQSITVYPATPTIPNPGQIQLKALGIFSPATSNNDLTSLASWASSNLSVATVDNTGMVSAAGCGTTGISAEYQGIIGQTQLIVSCTALQSITIYPGSPTIPQLGQNQQLRALGIYPPPASNRDISSLTSWASSNQGVATVSDSGLISAVGCGTSTISAMYQGIIGQTQLSVSCSVLQSVTVYPINPTILESQTEQLTALATYSPAAPVNDLTSGATWRSSNTAVASVDSSGVVTAAASSCGTTTISAQYQGVVGQTQLTVSCPAPPPVLQSINLYPGNPTIPQINQTVDFLALGLYSPPGSAVDLTSQAKWRSANEGIAAVDSGNAGSVRAVSCGSTTIQAEYNGVMGQMPLVVQCANDVTSLTVLPANPTISRAGQTTQFAAIATHGDGTQQDVARIAAWSSSNEQVATVDKTSGLALAVSCGTSTISAQYPGFVSTTQLTTSCGQVTSIELLVIKTSTGTDVTHIVIEDTTLAINCGLLCGSSFSLGTGVTLTALDSQGRVPVWNGCDATVDNECILTVRPDVPGGTQKTVIANY